MMARCVDRYNFRADWHGNFSGRRCKRFISRRCSSNIRSVSRILVYIVSQCAFVVICRRWLNAFCPIWRYSSQYIAWSVYFGSLYFKHIVNEKVLQQIHSRISPTKPKERWMGFLDPQGNISPMYHGLLHLLFSHNNVVVVAGFFGGIGRGLVEGPVEYIKVRRQVL